MKLALKIGLVVLIILLAFPLVNLFIQREAPEPDPANLAQNPEFSEVATILSDKCSDCHTSFADYPWYAKVPPAQGMIEEDIEKGREALDLTSTLTAEYGDMSPVGMAKVESVIQSGHMPPFRYVLLHWNNALDDAEANALADWIKEHRTENRALSEASKEFLGEPVAPIPAPEALDEDKVALGDRLFHDGRLSGDDTISCASCHDLAKGGTDQVKTSTGIDGQVGGINSPTVYNSTFSFVQFWDGRAKDLQEQAAGPVANPIEMGAEWPAVVEKLEEIPEYQVMFDQIYEDGITKENVTDAIATFEKTLVTPNSRFDQYLKGDKTALTEEEIQGYQVFKESGCTSCHFGVNLGGTHYEKMGKHADYFEGRELTEADQGRFNVTKDEKDRSKFKVPTLRNIAQTAPYFHDGITQDLSEAVRIMSEKQLKEPLSDDDIRQVAQFLRAQTGEYKGKLLE